MNQLKHQIWLGVFLVALNLLLLNSILDHTKSLRADLTEGDIFSLSPVTERIVGNLDEEVQIKAFISNEENLPEELRPTISQIRDLLEEYEERSDGRVKVSFLVPEDDEDAEKEAQEQYGLRPRAFLFQGKSEQGVRSFYFALAVDYAGSRPEVIPFNDLVDRGGVFDRSREIQLKNVEFALTRAIKKVVFGFENQRGLFARLKSKVVVRTWVSDKAALPEPFADLPGNLEKVMKELSEEGGERFRWAPQPLPEGEEAQMALARRQGIRPIGLPTDDESFYLWAQIEIDGRLTAPLPLFAGLDGAFSEFELRSTFENLVRRLSPGGLRTVGIVQKVPPPPNPMMGPQRGAPRSPFSALEESLREEYEVKSLDVEKLETVDEDVDVLIVTGRDALKPEAAYAVDQYLMRGGKIIFLVDGHQAEIQNGFALTSSRRESGLEDLLASWGVKISSEVALDGGNAGDFFWAVGRAGSRQRTQDFRWAAVPELGRSAGSVNRDLPFTGGVEILKLRFPSAIETKEVKGLSHDWVLRGSEKTWLVDPATSLAPVVDEHPETGYALPDEEKLSSRDFAVLVKGRFQSYWSDRERPRGDAAADSDKPEEKSADAETEKKDSQGPQSKLTAALSESPEDARIVVIANDDFVDDIDASISQGVGPPYGYYDQNQRFVLDTIGWMLEDDDLVSIRNRGRTFRPLERLEDDQKSRLQLWNFLGPILALLLVGVVTVLIRKNVRSWLEGASS